MPSNATPNPHDHFLKAILEDEEVAFHFFQTFLPEVVQSVLAMKTIRSAATSFITPELKGQFSDTVFEVDIRESKKKAFVSLLLEHKSKADRYTAIQVLSYLGLAYYKQSKSQQGIRPIIPFVFYHGKDRWHFKPVEALIADLPDVLRPYIPSYETIFVDLVRMPDEAIDAVEQIFLRSALTTQKYAHDVEALEAQINRIFSTLEPYRGRNLFRQLFVYFYRVYEIRGADPKILLNKVPEALKSDFMSLYDAIEQQGIEKGLELGMEKGIELSITNGYRIGLTVDQLAKQSGWEKEDIIKFLKSKGLLK